MTTTENVPIILTHKEQAWIAQEEDDRQRDRFTQDDLDHCPACGFDLGTHRPTCPTITANPNRPTGHNYCANCGHAPCIWHLNSDPSCLSQSDPITLQQHESRMIGARIDFMTADELRSALIFLSGANPALAERAIDYVHRLQ